jgi:hypothetical protein
MLWKRFVIADQQRGLVTKNGRFGGIFTPGEYALFVPPGVSLEVERHDIREIAFRSTWTDYLLKRRRALVDRHFSSVETNEIQIAMVYADGKLLQVLTPRKRALFWRGPADITFEVVDVISKPTGPVKEKTAVAGARNTRDLHLTPHQEAETCLFFVHSRLARARPPGKHGCTITWHEARLLKNAASSLSGSYGSRMQGCLITAATCLMRKGQQMPVSCHLFPQSICSKGGPEPVVLR